MKKHAFDELGDEFMVPIPDAIRDGEKEFLFEPGAPDINLTKRTMSSPVELSKRTRVTQLRTLAIAKWSPEKRQVGGINQAILDAVEQARLDMKLRSSAFDISGVRFFHDDTIDYTVQHADVARAAGLLVASRHTADNAAVKKRFKKKYGKLTDRIRDAMHVLDYDHYDPSYSEEYLTWDTTTSVAHRIQDLLKDFMENKKSVSNDMPEAEKMSPVTSDEIAESMLSVFKGGDTNEWAEMEVKEPPRPHSIPNELKARKTIKADTGAVPIALHRATIDGRVFRERRRKPGLGAVLIDQSGSMSMSVEDVEMILSFLPGAVIAGYASSGYTGELRVLARSGRRVEREDLLIPKSGNGVDGPALRWIEQFPGPRFWVSDGFITGRNDGAAGEMLTREVKETMGRARILRVPNCSELELRLARRAQKA